MRALFRVSTPSQLSEFTKLWAMLQDVLLQPRPDVITWRWTASGIYSTASAYRCQFVGACPPFRTAKIWRAKTEPKCHYFAWLALHGKILTADNLALRGWPHDPICKLCMIHPETVQHLLLDCSFTSRIRELVFEWNGNIGVAPPPLGHTLDRWWDGMMAGIPKERRREASGVFIYSMWGTWKERNRRVFRNTALQPEAVAHLVWEEIQQRGLAHSADAGG